MRSLLVAIVVALLSLMNWVPIAQADSSPKPKLRYTPLMLTIQPVACLPRLQTLCRLSLYPKQLTLSSIPTPALFPITSRAALRDGSPLVRFGDNFAIETEDFFRTSLRMTRVS